MLLAVETAVKYVLAEGPKCVEICNTSVKLKLVKVIAVLSMKFVAKCPVAAIAKFVAVRSIVITTLLG